MNDLKDFPAFKMSPKDVSFSGALIYNPVCALPPTIWYGIGIQLEPFDLGDSAPCPDLFGTAVDTMLCVGGIVLPFRDWREIHGSVGPVKNVGESSIYVSGVHNLIDIRQAHFRRIGDRRFRINLDLLIDFEGEGAGFRDTECSIEVTADYSGISFYAENRASDAFPLPADWKIPEVFDRRSVLEFFERFVDTTVYDLEQADESFRLVPCTHPQKAHQAQQTGTGQPATRSVDKPEGGVKPQPEAEGRRP